jgi:hypothetical protein
VRFLTANKDKNFVKSHGREPDKFIKKQGEFSLKNSCCGSGPCWTGSVLFMSTVKQCCGSGMFTPDPDFLPSPFSDPTTTKRGEGKKYFLTFSFLVTKNYTKSNFFFQQVQPVVKELK